LEVHNGVCVTACHNGSIGVVDLKEMKVVRRITGHPHAVWCVDFF